MEDIAMIALLIGGLVELSNIMVVLIGCLIL